MDPNKKILALDIGGSKMLSALVDVNVDPNGKRTTEISGIAKRALSNGNVTTRNWPSLRIFPLILLLRSSTADKALFVYF